MLRVDSKNPEHKSEGKFMRYVVVTLLFTFTAFAQHDNTWYFGQWAGLDFSSGVPQPLTNSAMSTIEGSAVMSDGDGNLLFYTNGLSVWNRNHVLMENGTGLFGDASTTQAALIVPKPGQPSHYYIFTPDDGGGPTGLHYSEVDMAAAAGLGAVINKNVPVIAPVCEKVVAAFHANGTDIWIITHHWGSNAFYSYLVTADGVSTTPVISNSGVVVDGAWNSGRYAGHMAISPQGTHLGILNSNVGIELFDFNNTTGTVSNARILKQNTSGYGIEFSPSGNMLYAVAQTQLLQYDVSAADPAATETLIANTSMPAAIRIGPDSKLYVITAVLINSMAVINNPDQQGADCNFAFGQASLGGRQTFVGLPTFLTSPFYIKGIGIIQNCSGTEVSFNLESTMMAHTAVWDFGDGNTSNQLSPVHIYTLPGEYVVRVKAKRGFFTRYFTRTVIVLPTAVANTPSDMVTCDDENNDGIGLFNLAIQTPQILGTQSPDDFSVTYHLSQSAAETGSAPLPENFINTVNPQTIYARVTGSNNGFCPAVTSFLVSVMPMPVPDMQDEYFVCNDEKIVLTAPAGYDHYEWSTGETTRSIIAGVGTYTITVFEDHDTITCEASKELVVKRSGAPVIKDIVTSDWTDNDNTLTILAEGFGNYEYSIDGTTYQDSPAFYSLPYGLYVVYVRDKNGCGISEKEIALLMYPRFFTPNGDGINDVWRINFAFFEPGLIVNIIDRYGKALTSFKGSGSWDGTYNGRNLPSTDYWFIVKRVNGKEYTGHFAMIR